MQMLKRNVDQHGGIMKKHEELISWILSDPQATIKSVTRDKVIIQRLGDGTASTIFIGENFRKTDVIWEFRSVFFNHSKHFEFAEGTSNRNMIEVIQLYQVMLMQSSGQ